MRTFQTKDVKDKVSRMDDLNQQVYEIKSKSDLVDFIRALIADFKSSGEEWESLRIDDYLKALSAWLQDMDGYFSNRNEEVPKTLDWKLFGMALLAAKSYE